MHKAGSYLYALALLIAGAAGLWRAPLTTDEAWFYDGAIRFFAGRLPHVPLDYPAPSPPLGFVLQSILFRVSGGSIPAVRAVSTLAAIVTVILIGRALKDQARGPLIAWMVGTFPPMLAYAFSLKQHWLTMAFIVSGYLLLRRGRDGWATLAFLCAVLTNQIAVAFVLAQFGRQLLLRRSLIPCLVPLAVLAALIAWWGGLQPPMYRVPGEVTNPGFQHLFWPQVLLLLFAAGIWIVPMIEVPWRRVALALVFGPLAAVALHYAGIMTVHPDNDLLFFKTATGPVLGLIRAVAGTASLSIVCAAIAVAAGGALFSLRDGQDIAHVQLYSMAYAVGMLPVPFFFESYYAVFVLGCWTILGPRMAASRSRFTLATNILAIIVGTGYGVFRFLVPS